VTGENLVNGLLRHQLASNHYVFDVRNVADINQWICLEQNQIGPFPHLNGALSIFPAQEVSGIDRGRLKGLKWGKPRLGEPLELIVKTEPRNEPIASGQEPVTQRVHILEDLQTDLPCQPHLLQSARRHVGDLYVIARQF